MIYTLLAFNEVILNTRKLQSNEDSKCPFKIWSEVEEAEVNCKLLQQIILK